MGKHYSDQYKRKIINELIDVSLKEKNMLLSALEIAEREDISPETITLWIDETVKKGFKNPGTIWDMRTYKL